MVRNDALIDVLNDLVQINNDRIAGYEKAIKDSKPGRSDLSVLELCEFGEDAAQKAYDEALKSDVEMPAKIREIIVNQKGQLRNAHDTIKRQRDLHAAAH